VPYREPDPTIAVPLTRRQCEAVRRGLAWVIRASPEAEADHALLVQSLGVIATVLHESQEAE